MAGGRARGEIGTRRRGDRGLTFVTVLIVVAVAFGGLWLATYGPAYWENIEVSRVLREAANMSYRQPDAPRRYGRRDSSTNTYCGSPMPPVSMISFARPHRLDSRISWPTAMVVPGGCSSRIHDQRGRSPPGVWTERRIRDPLRKTWPKGKIK